MNAAREAADKLNSGEYLWVQRKLALDNYYHHGVLTPAGCIYGILALATGHNFQSLVQDLIEYETVCSLHTQRAIADVLVEQYPDHVLSWPDLDDCSPVDIRNLIVIWNDDWAVNQEEIVTVLEKAAVKLEEAL